MDRSDPSCVSMKSDRSMDPPPKFQEHNKLDFGRVQMNRSDPSCVSMKSDRSMDPPPKLQEHNDLDFRSLNKQQISESLESICVSMNSDQSLNLSSIQKEGPDFRLCHFELSEKCCDCLTSVISSKSSCLRKMNLSENKLRDSGVKHLCVGLKNPNCKLKVLRLCDCDITDDGCAALASALRTNLHLKELDLSENNLRDSGVKMLSGGLENPNCKLEKLELRCCGVTDEGCVALASALRSNPSHLRYLNLSKNKIRDSGVKLLSDALKKINCELVKLRLSYCGVTDEGFAALASALRSNSHLKDLNLSGNKLGVSGVKRLSDGLKNPNCKLEKLVLWDCGVTNEGCAALASALRSNPSHLRELDLSENNLKDSGVKLLCDVLKNPNCKLETLWLSYCGVTDEGCTALASALRSNPSHLRDLNLFKNKLGDSGRKMLTDLKEDPHYKLETVNMVLEYGYQDLSIIKY